MLTAKEVREIFRDELQKAFNNISSAGDILSAKQVAELLNVTQQTIFKYAKVGLKHSKLGKNLIFKRSDVDEFISEIKRPTQAELLARLK